MKDTDFVSCCEDEKVKGAKDLPVWHGVEDARIPIRRHPNRVLHDPSTGIDRVGREDVEVV